MTWLDWFVWGVLCIQAPIPVFWLLVHPYVGLWRSQPRLVFLLAAPAAWLLVDVPLLILRERLFAAAHAPLWATVAGLALVAADGCFLFRIHRELGGFRLFGHAELAGAGELMQTGLYARVRHPRYTGMMAAVLGVCVMAGTHLLWAAAVAWWLLALVAVFLEERELRARFGAAYDAYARRVPRFLPFRFWPAED